MSGSCGQTISDEQDGEPRDGSSPLRLDLALRRWRLIWRVFGEQPCEEDARSLYGSVVVGEAGEVRIAGDEVVGVRGVEERKEVVIVVVG